jgi:AraC family transcriptional activator of tynA and feaB
MRTSSLEIANPAPNRRESPGVRLWPLDVVNATTQRRGPPLGRLWPRWHICAPALPPNILGINSCTDQSLVVVDSVLRSRMELEQEVAGGAPKLPYYCLYMADQETWLEPQSGATEQIIAYDIAMVNSESPLRTVSTADTRHLSVVLPRSLVLEYLPWADDLCNLSLNWDDSTRGTARALIGALRASLELDQFDAVGPHLAQAVLALLSTMRTETASSKPSVAAALWQRQVADCISRQFFNPALSVSTIAQELKVSARYLQRICEGGESPGERLRQFRLRKAAERLRNSPWKERSITEICYSCGFSNSSHFSTEFRRFYGVTPRQYRA